MNHKYVIGVHCYSSVMNVDANSDAVTYYAITDKAMQFLNYGIDAEYIGNSEKLYQYSFHVLVGVFDAGFGGSDGRVKNRSIYFEPEVSMSYNVTEWFRLCLGVSYRLVSGSTVEGYKDSDFSKLAATLTLELGMF